MPTSEPRYELSPKESALAQTIISELQDWPDKILNSHKAAGHPIHKLVFVADLGFTVNNPGIEPVVSKVLEHRSAQGPLQVLMNINPNYGGTGEDQWAWALCDAPLLLYALVRFGLKDEPVVIKGIDHLVELQRKNGWPCAVSPEMGKFRGPGRKDDPCPYANLIMLQLLSVLSDRFNSPEAQLGAETALTLWENRTSQHPYMFYAGTDFCKLKAPLGWYDIVHVLDVLSRFPYLRDDPRLLDMWQIIQKKPITDDGYIPESIYQAWKDWDFGQKKTPSAYLTHVIRRIEKQLQNQTT
ncbi:hypothetical protein AUK40_05840 [Candidatus Wirthbacteria bacterium CG2_30_54_11]|uniref:Nitrogen fixation protein NifH n=1 Tax=Candidatus Wirthbacteria bacterium CG2_30_54_11 TaxID=1817892 RepID=A0A1J5IF39_9BACT|nr:MAG: hypothetical protein AUK40_05840 [Candidatus Wirthbacteria bacterium CG2_30_54_11]